MRFLTLGILLLTLAVSSVFAADPAPPTRSQALRDKLLLAFDLVHRREYRTAETMFESLLREPSVEEGAKIGLAFVLVARAEAGIPPDRGRAIDLLMSSIAVRHREQTQDSRAVGVSVSAVHAFLVTLCDQMAKRRLANELRAASGELPVEPEGESAFTWALLHVEEPDQWLAPVEDRRQETVLRRRMRERFKLK